MPACHAREAIEFGAVAAMRHGERAVDGQAGIGLLPERDAALAERVHDRLGVVLLAAEREHGAGIDAARIRKGFARPFMDRDGMAAPGKDQRLPQADNARPADDDVVRRSGHQSPSATPSRRGSAPPSRPSEVTAMTCSPLVRSVRRTSWPMAARDAASASHSAPGSSRTAFSMLPKLTSALAAAGSRFQSIRPKMVLRL